MRARELLQAQMFRIEQRRHLFDTVLFTTRDFDCLLDLRGRFTFANKAFADMLVRTPDSMVGRDFHGIGFTYALAARLQSEIAEVIRTGQTLRSEMDYTTPAGYRLDLADCLDGRLRRQDVLGEPTLDGIRRMLFGGPRGERVRRHHSPDEPEAITRSVRKARKQGVPFKTVFSMKGSDGIYRRFLINIEPFRDHRGARKPG